jgi:hypothetical protein
MQQEQRQEVALPGGTRPEKPEGHFASSVCALIWASDLSSNVAM